METIARKSAILDDWCAKVGRDRMSIERSTGISQVTVGTADAHLANGISHFTVSTSGPHYDLGVVREMIEWRDTTNANR